MRGVFLYFLGVIGVAIASLSVRAQNAPEHVLPIQGATEAQVTTLFGAYGPGTGKMAYIDGQYHAAVDIAADPGTSVLAPTSGVIVYYRRKNNNGSLRWMDTFLVLRGDDKRDYILAHLECTVCNDTIKITDSGAYPPASWVRVKAGDVIGKIADLKAEAIRENYNAIVGNHLHLGVVEGKIVNDDGLLLPVYRAGNWSRIKGAQAPALNSALELGFVDPFSILPNPKNEGSFAPNFADYSDKYLSTEEVEVRVTRSARRRDYPSTEGTTILNQLTVGTALKGRWVKDIVNDRRWLKINTGGYVWEGVLAEELLPNFVGTWEFYKHLCCGYDPKNLDELPSDMEGVRVTFFKDGRFASNHRKRKSGRWEVLENLRDGSFKMGGNWTFTVYFMDVNNDVLRIVEPGANPRADATYLWQRVKQRPSSTRAPSKAARSVITTDGMFGVTAGSRVRDISSRLDMSGLYGSQGGWDSYQCEIYLSKDGKFSVLTERGIVSSVLTSSDGIQTISGAEVGMTGEDLKRIYGQKLVMKENPYVELPGADYFVYSSSGNGVKFSVGEDGKVFSITAGGKAIEYVEGCL